MPGLPRRLGGSAPLSAAQGLLFMIPKLKVPKILMIRSMTPKSKSGSVS
jgi:hypothetical protein